MNKSIAMKWVKALRSGKYKQGRLALRSLDRNGEYTYCCLGVLCEIQKSFPEDTSAGLDVQHLVKYKFNSPSGLIDIPTRPTGLSKYEQATLARLNDKGWPFKRIANYIEKYWKEL